MTTKDYHTYYTATDGTNLDHAMQSFTRPTGYSMVFEYYTNGKTFRHTDSLGQSLEIREIRGKIRGHNT